MLDQNVGLLCRAVMRAKEKSRFSVVAWVILPDHFHAIIDSPDGDTAKIVQRVKLSFSLQYQRASRHSGKVWQHRYWDHIIRSEHDLRRHMDYIHRNPVKHGLVKCPVEWRLSSFRRYVRAGCYDTNWMGGAVENEADGYGE